MSSSKGLLLIISGPSGVGKTTIKDKVVDTLDAVFSVSMTTRAKSAKDAEGIDYYFVSRQEFEETRDSDQLLEWAEYNGNYYGTPRKPLEEHLAAGRLFVVEIDVEGAINTKRLYPDSVAIFVNPPNEDELLNRLRARERESEEVIQKRFAIAKGEIKRAAECGAYDHFIINDDLDTAVAEAINLVKTELANRNSVNEATK